MRSKPKLKINISFENQSSKSPVVEVTKVDDKVRSPPKLNIKLDLHPTPQGTPPGESKAKKVETQKFEVMEASRFTKTRNLTTKSQVV